MKTKTSLVKNFEYPKKELSPSEEKILDKLIKAAELIAPIYEAQINDRYLGANFYPHNATREEILEAAKEDPQILSPYTIVERDVNKNLITIPYHIKYAKLLKPAITLIREAASLTENKEFSKRLEVQADALEQGSYEAAEIYWLTMEPYKINFIIGPIERYEDSLLFEKTCYTGVVGIIDENATLEAVKIRDSILTTDYKIFSFSRKIKTSEKINVRIDDAVVYGGLAARILFAGMDMPNNPYLVEKYGSQIMIFKTLVRNNFYELHYPIFKKLFEKQFQEGYTENLLLQASQTLILIREISTVLVKYSDAEKRLRELYPVIYEMASYVLAVKNAGMLLLKDVITQKDLEAIMIMFLSRAFDSFIVAKDVKSMKHYSQGYAIAVNYFLKSGALRVSKGISWVNFNKMYMVLNELATTLDQILAFGDIKDAQRLIDEYGYSKNISKLTPKIGKV